MLAWSTHKGKNKTFGKLVFGKKVRRVCTLAAYIRTACTTIPQRNGSIQIIWVRVSRKRDSYTGVKRLH